MEKWKGNPELPTAQLACYGLWRPDLNYNNLKDRKEMWTLGTRKNESAAVIFKDTIGVVLTSLMKVCEGNFSIVILSQMIFLPES